MALTALVVLMSEPTRAQDVPHARLRYDRGSDSCPDEAALRDAVSARLGYVPFADDAALVIEATIRRTGRGFRGELRVLAADGTLRGERSVASADGDCDELGRALALAISVAIDPLSLTRGAATSVPEPVVEPAPSQETECAPCAEVPVCPPPVEAETNVSSVAPPQARREIVVSLGVGVHAAIEAAPAQTIGATLDVAVRIGEHVSIGLEARADLPQSRVAPTGRGSVSASGAVSTHRSRT
jgi:hypothetical protein